MFTRKQYMAGDATHEEYYGQFVNDRILMLVKDRIGHTIGAALLTETGEGYSNSTGVCVLKAAARMIVESEAC